MRRVALGPSLRRVLLGSLATSVLAGAAAPALAAGEKPISLPAGSLEQALGALSAQTGDQLLFPPELVAGRRAPALTGRYTTEAALRRLLGDAPIEARRTAPRMVVLKPRKAPSGRAPRAPSPSDETATARPFADEAATPPRAASADAAGRGPADAPPTTTAEAVTLETVEVTGSHIRGAGVSASPLRVLSSEDLLRTGQATIAGALNTLPQVYGGQGTEGTVATNADTVGGNSTFATGINLRGLGANATLVLVNGRRVGGTGGAGDYADVSNIPGIAVSRVEILLDGASATYGSDAVGGVVNIILRRDLDGGEVRVSGGTGRDGTPREFQVGAVLGHVWGSGSVLLAYEGYQRDALAAKDRPYTVSADLRPFGGTDRRTTLAFPGNVVARDPATGVSGPFYGIPAGQTGVGLTPGAFQAGVLNRVSRQTGQDVLPAQRRQGGYVAVRQDLGDRIELSGDARYGFRAARIHNGPQTSTLTVGRANPFFVSPNGATSNQIQYSFLGELPNPLIRATAENVSASFGGRLRLSRDWEASGYLALAQEIDETHAGGFVNSAILAEALGNVADRPETAYAAVRDGYFNPYTGTAANPVSVTSAIGSGFSTTRATSRVRSANLQADGPLFRLPGGAVRAAFGVNARRETFARRGTSFTSTPLPAPQAPLSTSRRVEALFAEVRAPLVGDDNARPGVEALELSGAVRTERFSDFGRTVDPKFGVVWAPVQDLRLRATYGQSFRAPGLTQLFALQSVTALGLTLDGRSVQTLAFQGGNTELQPETAETWTAGLDYQPAWSPGTRLSLTWFDTDFKNRIGRPVQENLTGALTDPRFAAYVRRVSPATNPADLALVNAALALPIATSSALLNPPASYVAIVELRTVNTGQLHIRGLDVQASHEWSAFGGRLTLSGDATRIFDYDQRLTPNAPSIDLAGVTTYPAKLRGRLSADYSRGPVSGGVSLNYVGGSRDLAGTRVDDQATVDLQLRLKAPEGRLAGTTLSLNVRNVFDKAPPFYDNPFGFAYDPANADVVGRFVRLQLTRSW